MEVALRDVLAVQTQAPAPEEHDQGPSAQVPVRVQVGLATSCFLRSQELEGPLIFDFQGEISVTHASGGKTDRTLIRVGEETARYESDVLQQDDNMAGLREAESHREGHDLCDNVARRPGRFCAPRGSGDPQGLVEEGLRSSAGPRHHQ